LRIDGYDAAGNHVTDKTDLIALYIHNRGINFSFTGPQLTDPAIVNAGCGLYRLTDAQNDTPMSLAFEANDPYGFLDNYNLSMSRCPAPTIALQASPMADTASGANVLAGGASTSVHNACSGYTGTLGEFGAGSIATTLEPAVGEDGWIRSGEYFTIYSFGLTASQRVTNGYNTGLSGLYQLYGQIMMEKLNP
jgi:hypothetical protein